MQEREKDDLELFVPQYMLNLLKILCFCNGSYVWCLSIVGILLTSGPERLTITEGEPFTDTNTHKYLLTMS